MDGKQGVQYICIDKDTLPLHVDEWKCFLHIKKQPQEELKSFTVYDLSHLLIINLNLE